MFTLGRTVDIHYRTNQLIVIITALTIILVSFTIGDFITGLKIGGTIFLTWAMSRELDPKREYAAFVSLFFAAYSFFLYFEVALDISLMEIFFFMLILRLISTTCGKEPTGFDAGTVFAIASYLSYNLNTPICLLLSLIGIFISGVFKKSKKMHVVLIGLALGSVGYLLYRLFTQAQFKTPLFSFSSLAVLLALYSLHTFFDFKKEKKIYDDANNTIAPIKILKSQWFFVVSILVLVLLSNLAVGNFILYVSSLGGTVLYGIISRIFHLEE